MKVPTRSGIPAPSSLEPASGANNSDRTEPCYVAGGIPKRLLLASNELVLMKFRAQPVFWDRGLKA